MEFIIKPLSRYQGAVFGGFWGYQMTDITGWLIKHVNANIHNPFKLFGLSFTDKIIDKLIERINKYAELYPLDKEAEYLRI